MQRLINLSPIFFNLIPKMSSPSPVSSTSTSQTVCPEEVTNQALMSAIMDLRAKLVSMSSEQDRLVKLVNDLSRRGLDTHTEP